MTDFNVRIIDDNGDTSLYPTASSIMIVDGNIRVTWGDESAQHCMDETDKIIIKPNP